MRVRSDGNVVFRTKEAKPIRILLLLLVLALSKPVHGQSVTNIRIDPLSSILRKGDTATIAVRIEDASDVFGFQIFITYDPAVVRILDADDGTEGVQVQPGDLLQEEQGFIVMNEADNATGILSFAMTLLAPAEAASGDGYLILFELEAVSEGSSELYISDTVLASMDGVALSATLAHGQVLVGGQNPPPSVTPIPTSPPATATPSPTATPTANVATATSTKAPATVGPTSTALSEKSTPQATAANRETPTSAAMARTSEATAVATGITATASKPADSQTPFETRPPVRSTPTGTETDTYTAEIVATSQVNATLGATKKPPTVIGQSVAAIPRSTAAGTEDGSKTVEQDSDMTAMLIILVLLVVAAGVSSILYRRRQKAHL